MTDKKKPEELNEKELDQVSGGLTAQIDAVTAPKRRVASTAGGTPDGVASSAGGNPDGIL